MTVFSWLVGLGDIGEADAGRSLMRVRAFNLEPKHLAKCRVRYWIVVAIAAELGDLGDDANVCTEYGRQRRWEAVASVKTGFFGQGAAPVVARTIRNHPSTDHK